MRELGRAFTIMTRVSCDSARVTTIRGSRSLNRFRPLRAWTEIAPAHEGDTIERVEFAGISADERVSLPEQRAALRFGRDRHVAAAGLLKRIETCRERQPRCRRVTRVGTIISLSNLCRAGFTAADGTSFQTHWYENLFTGQQVEPKVTIDRFGGR